ncbi:hypothetical protein [Micromonospora sp. RV43]|nr:hypothetical protein [Micromonospora sp. RV43]
MDALKKDQALRRKATEAAKSNHYDKMRGEELEAEFTVTAFLAAGGSLQGSNELVTREGSLVR